MHMHMHMHMHVHMHMSHAHAHHVHVHVHVCACYTQHPTSNILQELLRDPHALWRAQARQREIAATRPARLKTVRPPRPLRQPSGGGGGGGSGKHKQGGGKQHGAAQAALRAQQQALRAASQAAQAARDRVKRHEGHAWDRTTKAAIARAKAAAVQIASKDATTAHDISQ
jgi:hypothetical protein